MDLLQRIDPLVDRASAAAEVLLTWMGWRAGGLMLVGMALFGLGLYGKVERAWLLQLVASTLWLRRYRFGPLEWLWRSLTYWQRQQLRSSRVRTQATSS